MTTSEVLEIIDNATAVGVMSAEDALEFLLEIKEDLDSRIEALRSDLSE